MTTYAVNKRAKFDYEILETFEAGIALKGFEVKAIKNNRIQIKGAYAVIKDNEIWLLNADIAPYQPSNMPPDYESKRSRRLLLNKAEIKNLTGKLQQKGLTLVVLDVYNKRGLVKLKIGLDKSRKKYDKREIIKKRETERELRRSIQK